MSIYTYSNYSVTRFWAVIDMKLPLIRDPLVDTNLPFRGSPSLL